MRGWGKGRERERNVEFGSLSRASRDQFLNYSKPDENRDRRKHADLF